MAGVHRNFVGLAERGAQNNALLNLTKLAQGLKVRPAGLIKTIPPSTRVVNIEQKSVSDPGKLALEHLCC
jgi:hypothetical protein